MQATTAPSNVPPFQIVLTLIGTLLLIVWLRHTALDTYWQQTRHRESGLAPFSQSPLGQMGSEINQEMEEPFLSLAGWLDSASTRMVTAANILLHGPVSTPSTLPSLAMSSALPASVSSVGRSALAINMAQYAHGQPVSPALVGGRRSNDGKIVLTQKDKVLFIGDSMMQGVAPLAIRTLQREYGIASVDASKQSTGLTYPGYFDWPKTVKTLVPQHGITTLVVFLGANDTWDMILDGKYERFGTARWQSEYEARIADILQYAQNNKVEVVWLGAPAMGKDKINAGVPTLNQLFERETLERHARFVPTQDIVGSGPAYNKYRMEGERKVAMRTDDGVHFTRAGQQKLADAILAQFQLPAAAEAQ
ncbi:SGNH/GDSL hydrolase family protein [Chitinilyticum piscinae]|uniref:DUF459 domain-containing protein n=1 Tax=Chitinilyticum piscinae TaxID=2866724 RepID=A0A8J7K7Q5_9NEIS|nr:DUF459 domain-containing protein [Chitinilyticum piscinae]MBE9608443.1 DUF459 domain-containing protein [Chitinilyticum piscinae]